MHHIQYCIDELRAEFEAKLTKRPAETANEALASLAVEFERYQRAQELLDELASTILAGYARAVEGAGPALGSREETGSEAASSVLAVEGQTERTPDNLLLIQGVSIHDMRVMEGCGFSDFLAIAAWMHPDVMLLTDAGIPHERISQENWIEQAAILATGAMTAFASKVIADADIKPVEMSGVSLQPPQIVDHVDTPDEQLTCEIVHLVQVASAPHTKRGQRRVVTDWVMRAAACLIIAMTFSLAPYFGLN